MNLGPAQDDPLRTVRPERFVAGGEALVRTSGEPVMFVRGAVPGETVRVRINRTTARWVRAEVAEVQEASQWRREPPCPRVAEGCGGCDWQHLDPVAQLEAKTQIVADAVARTGGIDPMLVRATGRVEPEGYRTTIRLRGGGSGVAGFHAAQSHIVVDARGCQVAHPALRAVLEQIRLGKGTEVTLRASVATGEMTAMWDGGAVRGLPEGVAVGPEARLIEHVGARRLQVAAGSFFQSGPQAAALLVDTVRTLIPEVHEARHLVDAYGGVGLFAASLASPEAQITLIETSPTAVADAQFNLEHWVAAGRAEIFAEAVEDWHAAAPAEVVIADPARAGLGAAGVRALLSAAPEVIALVSCDPAAGARDLGLLVAAGYEVEAVAVLDLFPHTHHVEMVSRVIRGGSSVRRTAP